MRCHLRTTRLLSGLRSSRSMENTDTSTHEWMDNTRWPQINVPWGFPFCLPGIHCFLFAAFVWLFLLVLVRRRRSDSLVWSVRCLAAFSASHALLFHCKIFRLILNQFTWDLSSWDFRIWDFEIANQSKLVPKIRGSTPRRQDRRQDEHEREVERDNTRDTTKDWMRERSIPSRPRVQ